MKILILSSAFPPNVFGGGEVSTYNMAKLLARRGHDVSVVTSLEKTDSPAWGEKMPEGYKLYRLKIPRSHTCYSRTDNVPVWKKPFWHLQDYFDPRNIRSIRKLLDEIAPDHVDIHNIVGLGFNILPEIGKRGISVTYFLHDLNPACFRGPMFKNGENCTRQCPPCSIVGFLRQGFLKKIPKLGFVSPSKANLDRLLPFAPVIEKSPNIVIRNVSDDLPPLPKRTQSKKVRLIYVGRIDPIKGVDFLLEILKDLSPTYDFHLTILGSGPQEASLKQQYESQPWVTFKGFVDRSEVATSIAQSDLLCMTSLWAETYGLVTAQALEIGTPVIGSNIGGTVELVRHNKTGLLLEPGDKKSWTAAFQKIFTEPKMLEEWRSNTEKYKNEFDADTIGIAYEKFVEGLRH